MQELTFEVQHCHANCRPFKRGTESGFCLAQGIFKLALYSHIHIHPNHSERNSFGVSVGFCTGLYVANTPVTCPANVEVELKGVLVLRGLEQHRAQFIDILWKHVTQPLFVGHQFLFIFHAVNFAHGAVPANELVLNVVFPNSNTCTLGGQLKAFVVELLVSLGFFFRQNLLNLIGHAGLYHQHCQYAKGQVTQKKANGLFSPLGFHGRRIGPGDQVQGNGRI